MLKVGRKTIWDKIEVGEVFAGNGCWSILYKINDKQFLFLAHDNPVFGDYGGMKNCIGSIHSIFLNGITHIYIAEEFYKLPKKVQRLWITE